MLFSNSKDTQVIHGIVYEWIIMIIHFRREPIIYNAIRDIDKISEK